MRPLALLDQLNRHAGAARLLEQVRQPRETGLRRVAGLVGAENIEKATHLAHRLARCAPNRVHVLTRLFDGSFDAQPIANGGFRVHATLPLTEEPA